MRSQVTKVLKNHAAIRVRTIQEKGCRTTRVKIDRTVEVGTRDGWLCFWTAGREVRVGPVTPDQAEKLAEDLAYDALE